MHPRKNSSNWMHDENGVFIDIHRELREYHEVLSFFKRIQRESSVKEYCNGSNAGGRWIYQIYSDEFIDEIAGIINELLNSNNYKGPILEVMSGDGKLSEFLRPKVNVQTIVTDAKTSRDNIEFPKWIETKDAIEAIDQYNPSIVVMCWEPFYSDVSLDVIKRRIPTIWIGDPSSSAVSTGLSEMDHKQIIAQYALCRHDDFLTGEYRTVIRLFNS
ncbi:MAG: hypothetical protein P1Q69_07505 [Candidatus Thorarchaeota archaeon]|nr:hypothetical protein [Candidatus Thorarchaeota archaeon]